MGTSERILEILKHLCRARKSTMPKMAELFAVSVRTIQRDILEIEATFHVPIYVLFGKYDGGYMWSEITVLIELICTTRSLHYSQRFIDL